MSVEKTLGHRKARYGDFTCHAETADKLIAVVELRPGWGRMPPFVRHAIRYILDKVARAVEGDCLYTDNPHDIQGYAKLWEDRAAAVNAQAEDQT